MPIWIFRFFTLTAFPLLVFQYINQDWRYLLGGLLCGAIVLAGEVLFKRMRLIKIMIGCTGFMIGYLLFLLLEASLQSFGTPNMMTFWSNYARYIQLGLEIFGVVVCLIKARDLEGLSYTGHHLKVADISALIDGRIVDLCDINFLSGVIVLPIFVMEELQKMASAKDPLERAKGRRGMDVASRLQENKEVEVRLTSKNPKGDSMEEKIVKLSKSLDAEIVTLDFNINKLAALKKVVVKNIADLATALKPVVLPGETMSLFIMKDGKEKEQGIGYLDDGTMVVVEEGRKHIGKRTEVSVYSILQTSSGRMIFAKIK